MIELVDISIQAGAFSLSGVSLAVGDGEYGVLMGRTGVGKTCLLEVLAGLRRPVSGRVRLAGRDVTELPPGARGVGYVPQDGALFPAMGVGDQLAFPLRLRKWSRPDQEQRVLELAGWLGIGHLLERQPRGLSGGERQRVALGRALAFRPAVLILDEPLVGLDEETRSELISLLQRAREEGSATALHVTHSREEAALLADRAFRLVDGRIGALDLGELNAARH